MTRRRLLLVATVAGTLRAFLLPFAHHFRRQGWRVDAMASGVTGCRRCAEAFDHVWEVGWSRHLSDPRRFVQATWQARSILAREEYDLLHVHTPVAAFVARLAVRDLRPRLKVIYTAHGFHFHPGGSPWANCSFLALEKLAGRWTDYLVTMNRDDETAARQHRLVRPGCLWPMPGIGVDTGFYRPDPAQDIGYIRQELGLRPGDKLFAMVAEFIPRKRHRDAVSALARLGRPDVHLALAGSGPLLGEMGRLAAKLGLHKQVHLLGLRRDIPALVRASEATLLPSTREGLPRTVMESLSLEVPVIGTAIRGVRDLVTADCGILVEVGNVPQLCEAMAWMLAHPDEAREMGACGRRRIVERYDLKGVIDQHEALYAEALGQCARKLAYA